MPEIIQLGGTYAFNMHVSLTTNRARVSHSETIKVRHTFDYRAPMYSQYDSEVFKIMLLLNHALFQMQINLRGLHFPKLYVHFEAGGHITLRKGDDYFYYDVANYQDFANAVQKFNLSLYGTEIYPFDDDTILTKPKPYIGEHLYRINGELGFSGNYAIGGFNSDINVHQRINMGNDEIVLNEPISIIDLGLLQALISRAHLLATRCRYFYKEDDSWPDFAHILHFAPLPFAIALETFTMQWQMDNFNKLQEFFEFVKQVVDQSHKAVHAPTMHTPLLESPAPICFTREGRHSKVDPEQMCTDQQAPPSICEKIRAFLC